MNNETLSALVKVEEEYVKDAKSLDDLLDTDAKTQTILAMEKAQKLELDERRMRLEESKQKLENDKLEQQKKQAKKDNIIKILVGFLTGAGGILVGLAKLKQVRNQRKYVQEAYAIEEVTTLTSNTARNLLSDGTNPKL